MSTQPIIRKIDLENFDLTTLQNGDVIFRRGIGIVSEMVLASDNSCPYSHVGLIKIEDGKIFVIHSSPADVIKKTNFVEKELIQSFLCDKVATDFEIMRVKSKSDLKKVINYADSLYHSKAEFDDEFDLIDSKKFYCTELIYKSFLNSGMDLTAGKFDTLLIPIGKNPYLLPRTLYQSSVLVKINPLKERSSNEKQIN
ncbi:MAG: hypothetical protein Fur0015_13390 [Ignavibacteriales bacterium]